MTDPRLESAIRSAIESEHLDDPAAIDSRTDACLNMTQLAALARSPARNADTPSHLSACRICALRLRAFRETDALFDSSRRVQRLLTIRRWATVLTGISAAAACFALLLSPQPRRGRPGRPRIASVWHEAGLLPTSICIQGDANCDGEVTRSDIPAFLVALNQPNQYAIDFPGCDPLCADDINGDGVVDEADLAAFVQCVEGG